LPPVCHLSLAYPNTFRPVRGSILKPSNGARAHQRPHRNVTNGRIACFRRMASTSRKAGVQEPMGRTAVCGLPAAAPRSGKFGYGAPYCPSSFCRSSARLVVALPSQPVFGAVLGDRLRILPIQPEKARSHQRRDGTLLRAEVADKTWAYRLDLGLSR
jgi:hypothetical protein